MPDRSLAHEIASSGIMYNLAEHPKSIRAVATRLLKEALEQREKPVAPCDGCKGKTSTRVVYRVAPTKFLPNNQQDAVCHTLARDTLTHPFQYAEKSFKSVEALNSWVMTFSQGNGEEGRDLYQRCLSNCSPQYEFRIHPVGKELAVATRVRCGLARDRESEDYEVSTALGYECQAGRSRR